MERLMSMFFFVFFLLIGFISIHFFSSSDDGMSEPFNTANLKLKKPSPTSGISNDHWDKYEKLCRLEFP
jgi:hypothetical protein